MVAHKKVGRLIFYQGDALVDSRKVSGPVPLYIGSVIETGNGYATLAFGDSDILDLDIGTRFRVVMTKIDALNPDYIRIAGMLDRGKIKGSHSETAGSSLQIFSPGGQLNVEGGRFLVDAPKANDSAKVNFLSVDKPAGVALVLPEDAIDTEVLDATSTKQSDFFDIVDVDGGDSITGRTGTRTKHFKTGQSVKSPAIDASLASYQLSYLQALEEIQKNSLAVFAMRHNPASHHHTLTFFEIR